MVTCVTRLIWRRMTPLPVMLPKLTIYLNLDNLVNLVQLIIFKNMYCFSENVKKQFMFCIIFDITYVPCDMAVPLQRGHSAGPITECSLHICHPTASPPQAHEHPIPLLLSARGEHSQLSCLICSPQCLQCSPPKLSKRFRTLVHCVCVQNITKKQRNREMKIGNKALQRRYACVTSRAVPKHYNVI